MKTTFKFWCSGCGEQLEAVMWVEGTELVPVPGTMGRMVVRPKLCWGNVDHHCPDPTSDTAGEATSDKRIVTISRRV